MIYAICVPAFAHNVSRILYTKCTDIVRNRSRLGPRGTKNDVALLPHKPFGTICAHGQVPVQPGHWLYWQVAETFPYEAPPVPPQYCRMTNLDPRSMIALAGFMSALMAIVLACMRRYYPAHIRGISSWAAAPVFWLASTALFSARSLVPDWMSLVGANMLLVLGTMTYYMGTRAFLGHAHTWRIWGAVLTVCLGVFTWLSYGWPNYSVRLSFFTLVMSCIYGAQLRFLLRHGGSNFPVRLAPSARCSWPPTGCAPSLNTWPRTTR
jgi:hypothetical protein